MAKDDFIAAVVSSVISVLAYQSGFFFFLFLIPLQVLIFRHGLRSALLAVAGVGAALASLGIKRASSEPDGNIRSMLLITEFSIFLLLLGGFLFINRRSEKIGKVLTDVFVATGAVAVISIFLFSLLDNETFKAYYLKQLGYILDVFKNAVRESGSYDFIPAELNAEMLMAKVLEVFFKGFLFAYFAILAVSYLFALSVSRKLKREYNVKTEIMIPYYFVWVLIVSLGIVLIDVNFPLYQAGYAGWNLFLIIMLLYGIRGVEIIRQMFEVYKVPVILRFCIVFLVISLLMQSKLGILFLIGVPCIGISEIWIKYKRT